MLTQTPRGTKDIFGTQILLWQKAEDTIRKICAAFCAEEIRTPMFEHTELFLRGVGEETDVVQKEMYTFLDKGNRSLTLRPEFTAGVARAYIEHKLHADPSPTRLYYVGPNFRYERPAAGRMRQFHQFGAECFGSYDPAADAEMISLADTVLSELNINGYTININSLGGTACRAKYNEVLKTFLKENLSALCPVCQTRYETNPLRVLDCKDESCKEILVNSPIPLDSLDTECKLHWEKLQSLLDTLDIQYTVNGRIVRGLDYYTRTVFEFIDADTGLTICGGGRYDRLIEECGGAATGAVGFAMGLERIISMMPDALTKRPYVYIGAIGEAGFYKAQSVAQTLRRSGIRAQPDIVGRGVKAQMRFADKTGAIYSFIIGDDEMVNHQVKIKDMRTNSETAVSFNELLNFFS